MGTTAMQRDKYAIIWRYKATHPCVDCGETDPVVLEFDHREKEQKQFNIGEGGRHASIPRLLEEMNKCDIRCANCHRRRTWLANRAKFGMK